MRYLVMSIKPLAFRPVAPLNFPAPGSRCSGCRERIQGQPSRDEHHVPYHAECLLKRKEVACG